MNGKDVLKRFWESQAEEVKEEPAKQGQNDHLDPYTIIEFVSESRGRGKKRIRAREVTLVKSASGRTYSVKPDVPHNDLDTTADLAAGSDYRDGMSSWKWFIHQLRNRGR